jgi:hypothetical protein
MDPDPDPGGPKTCGSVGSGSGFGSGSGTLISRKEIARPQSQFSVSDIGPHIFLQQNRQTDSGNIYKSLT